MRMNRQPVPSDGDRGSMAFGESRIGISVLKPRPPLPQSRSRRHGKENRLTFAISTSILEGWLSCSNFDPPWCVHLQGIDCRPAYRSLSHDPKSVEPEVILPSIQQGVEKSTGYACVWIETIDAVALVEITTRASKNEIGALGASAPADWDHMFNVKRSALERLVHPAVIAPLPSPGSNFSLQGGGNAHLGSRFSSCRAWARINESSSLRSDSDANSWLSSLVKSPSVFRSIRS